MNGYEVFVHDDRYSVPTLYLITADDLAHARESADAMLRASPHHLGIELWTDGEQVAAIGLCAERKQTGAALRLVK